MPCHSSIRYPTPHTFTTNRSSEATHSFFRTREISSDEFKVAIGKTVSAEASRARDGSRSGLIRTITLPDGKVISLCPQNC